VQIWDQQIPVPARHRALVIVEIAMLMDMCKDLQGQYGSFSLFSSAANRFGK
jgi:hypothetical protein